jgi:quercetin dioxygenase-like cupin family protein
MPTQPDKPSTERVAKSPLPDKPTSAPAEMIDLQTEARQLRDERPYQEHGQAAKTLVKHEHFRVVLIALKAGRRCREHDVEESVSVQAVTGRVRAHLASEGTIDLRTGCVLALEPERAHDFEALEDSTLLLTLAWTGHRDHGEPRRTH